MVNLLENSANFVQILCRTDAQRKNILHSCTCGPSLRLRAHAVPFLHGLCPGRNLHGDRQPRRRHTERQHDRGRHRFHTDGGGHHPLRLQQGFPAQPPQPGRGVHAQPDVRGPAPHLGKLPGKDRRGVRRGCGAAVRRVGLRIHLGQPAFGREAGCRHGRMQGREEVEFQCNSPRVRAGT